MLNLIYTGMIINFEEVLELCGVTQDKLGIKNQIDDNLQLIPYLLYNRDIISRIIPGFPDETLHFYSYLKANILPENNKGINLVPQIIVNSVSEFKILVDAIEALGYNQIDINMGCPFPLQTGKGRGSGLLSRIDVVKDLMEEVKKCQEISFSIKMRLGLNDCNESVKLLPLLNNTPLRQIVIHPRIGRQQYKGDVNNEKASELLRVESLLKVFLPKINCDIVEVYYKTESPGNDTRASLYRIK
jgi:tRNA-dihydrouridine synthase